MIPKRVTNHDKLVQAAEDAITDLFSDSTVSPATTESDLKDLKDFIELKIDSLGDI